MSRSVDAAVALLDVGRMNDGMKHKADHIDDGMTLLALDLLACVINR